MNRCHFCKRPLHEPTPEPEPLWQSAMAVLMVCLIAFVLFFFPDMMVG